jgi:hypothetical protein
MLLGWWSRGKIRFGSCSTQLSISRDMCFSISFYFLFFCCTFLLWNAGMDVLYINYLIRFLLLWPTPTLHAPLCMTSSIKWEISKKALMHDTVFVEIYSDPVYIRPITLMAGRCANVIQIKSAWKGTADNGGWRGFGWMGDSSLVPTDETRPAASWDEIISASSPL